MSEMGTALAARLDGRYRVERLLGRGGMGAVFLARDVRLDRAVAIKELPAEFAGDALLRERFLREVKTAAGFSHPNIVPVYGVEESADALAFVMGYVEGSSLADRVRRLGPLGTRDAVRLLQDIGYALAYAHGRGVVHRDLKPDNIMIERATGRALLMDFGVARTTTAAAAPTDGMTRVGEVVGTPEYMSPEQATGDVIDGRSDIYSLGLTAYFALTGEIAYGGDSVQRILVRQLTEELPPLASKRPDLPGALCDIVDRCTAKDRDERFVSAEALVEALDAAQAAAPEVALPVRLYAHEIESLGLIGVFMAIFMLVIFTSISQSASWLDALLPLTVLSSIFMGRVLQTRAEAGRLRADGFTSAIIHDGFRVIMEEREERRQQLRADSRVVSRRRQTVIVGLFMLMCAPALIAGALRYRTPLPGSQGFHTGIPGVIMLFSGLVLLGLGMVLLLRSPFRASMPERLFRTLAFGPLSALLVGPRETATADSSATAAPTVNRRASRSGSANPSLPPAATSHAGPNDVTLQALRAIEARLATIEAKLVSAPPE